MVRSTIPLIDKSNPKRSNAKKEDLPFIVNRSGFPLGEDSWEKMWQFAVSQYPDKIQTIMAVRYAPVLPKVIPPPVPQLNGNKVNVWEYTLSVQDYMEKLQYNHTGTQFFEIKKTRSLAGLMETAKSMVDEALPIKCLESVILGVYLTNGVSGLERFPINFKSKFYGKNYYHVVLGIHYMGVYGTLGLSRRSDLMYKPLLYKTLSDLIFDFVECYRRYLHNVVKITIGNYVSHVFTGNEMIVWKGVSLHMQKMSEDYARREIDKYARQMRNNTVPLLGKVIPMKCKQIHAKLPVIVKLKTKSTKAKSKSNRSKRKIRSASSIPHFTVKI